MDSWIEKGDWQTLAEEVRADRIFFVEREPVIVFAELSTSDDESFRHFYNQVWCMARPQLLFVARPGELAVYDLTKPPFTLNETPAHCRQLLTRVQTAGEIQALRQKYHRELIESGAIFGEEYFGKRLDRADYALIRDLKAVRRDLSTIKVREGTHLSSTRKLELLHALIGRAIFIRYLEDREIITSDYFEKVIALHATDADQRKDWRDRLQQPLPRQDIDPAMNKLLFPRVLGNKDFAYALFEQLTHDFNGDSFPVEQDERRCFLSRHLITLRDFLLGVRSSEQELFFYAYNFKIIPIELISSIYEEFYNERVGDEKNQGSHYTPSALVEFVLAQTLTREVLVKKPRILDPACGSGIFLVEAFRRVVRWLCAQQGKERPTRQELRTVLRDQIAGIDLNEEAVRVAAFSLYLAFLHYQKPREILPDPGENLSGQPAKLRAVRLPHLKCFSPAERIEREKVTPNAEFFDILLASSAFDPVMGNCDPEVNNKFGARCADVIVGNPPWGDPKPTTARETQAVVHLKQWCDAGQGRPVGDNERSQAFLHLAINLLKDGGKAGLLVSSGVFFKHHDNSKAFRNVWLNTVQLRHVVNFAHVRKVFFTGPTRTAKSISPFASVVFEKTPLSDAPNNHFEYWSAKRTAVVENTKAVLMTRGDMHTLPQRDCIKYEKLWKIYWWGGHREEALIRNVERYPKLLSLPDIVPNAKLHLGQGFKEGNKSLRTGWLEKYRELRVPHFERYGSLDLSVLVPVPRKVERRGVKEVFSGRRLLVRRGITEPGILTARFEKERFCFRNSIEAVRFEGFEAWQERTILGIFWSSLARFYFFATAGSWGLWHDELHLENVKQMPICFPGSPELRERIVGIVTQLQNLRLSSGSRNPSRTASQQMELTLLRSEARATVDSEERRRRLEGDLDEAIFDLYDLTPSERDLVCDMCKVGLDFFYQNQRSEAVKPVVDPQSKDGTFTDVANANEGLSAYLRIFIEWWNEELGPDGELAWRILSPPTRAPLLAVIFETRFRANGRVGFDSADDTAWQGVVGLLSEHAHIPLGSSQIFTDTFFRITTDREILIVKRNERRFWTKSAAREDAEAAMLKLMRSQPELATA